jgi:hypothetical protein
MPSPRPSVFRTAALDRLSSPDQLDERLQIVSSRAWLALVAVGALVFALVVWAFLGHIAVKVSGDGRLVAAETGNASALTAVVFVEAREARRIRPGMPAEILPATYLSTEDGFLRGTVQMVDDRPASRAELMAVFGDEARAQRLVAAAALKVTIAVPSAAVRAGVPCAARLVVADERPVALVLPAVAPLFRR